MNEEDKLLDHEYDGIQELDNNLPLWWLWTFFISIIFSFIYWIHYSLSGDGPTLDEELAGQMAVIEKQREQGDSSEASQVEKQDPQVLLAQGTKIFKNNCASCHLENGGGSIGPNLTDGFWIHGSTNEEVKIIIEKGVLDKGMPPWSGILRPQEIESLVAFIDSLRNQNVSGGKEAQGVKVSE